MTKVEKFVSKIKGEALSLRGKSTEELSLQIERIQKRSRKESLDKVLVEWFALVQEISFREIGLKHYDSQLVAGLLLHEGKIVEMKTGEGKTLASTLPVSLNALSKKGVHVVTVNEYLAERDQKWMGKVYQGLGLSVGLVKSNSQTQEKIKSYNADITYVTNSEVVFDYLRDSSAYMISEVVQRPFNYCIIDEIDSILIDEARTPLIISTIKGQTNIEKLRFAKEVANLLEKDVHFQVDEKKRDINLTQEGYKEATRYLGINSLYNVDDPWILEILNALKARHLFKLNKDYIVLKNKILIVDEFTGRIMEDRRWSMGIHEAIETKEEVEIGEETKTKTSITYQNFFTIYPKLSGMTGTGKTAEKEFKDIYNLDVVIVPTEKPLIRQDLGDLVYQTELIKWKAVIQQSIECYKTGQPILIGTSNVEKSEFLSELFQVSKIPHQVLNAKPENVFRESEIVAQAGERFAVTIATNMAGRGTDIILGGNPSYKVKQKMISIFLKNEALDLNEESALKPLITLIFQEYSGKLEKLEKNLQNLPYSIEEAFPCFQQFYEILVKLVYATWEKEHKRVKELGGLFVLGTERHETRRIDNQLRGRSGRQGDPGISRFFVSLEDDLVKVFGGENIRKWVGMLMEEEEAPLESNLLTKSLENAQERVELSNYEIRKNVFEYDNVLNRQRKLLFQSRKNFLINNIFPELLLRLEENESDLNISQTIKKNSTNNPDISLVQQVKNSVIENYGETWISQEVKNASLNIYENGMAKKIQTTPLLLIIDDEWTNHIERMNYLRETINWKSYGQQNPLIEYNLEGKKSFKQMFRQIRESMLNYFLTTQLIA